MLPTKTNRDTLTIHQKKKKKQPPRTMKTYDVSLLLLLLLFLSVLFAKLRILSIEMSVFYFYYDATEKRNKRRLQTKCDVSFTETIRTRQTDGRMERPND